MSNVPHDDANHQEPPFVPLTEAERAELERAEGEVQAALAQVEAAVRRACRAVPRSPGDVLRQALYYCVVGRRLEDPAFTIDDAMHAIDSAGYCIAGDWDRDMAEEVAKRSAN